MVYGRILVPVDRNETTRHAVDWGIEYAGRLDVPVDLLHVVEDGPGRLASPSGSAGAPASDFPGEIERLASDEERVSQHVVSGDPATEILRFAAENDTDLVVVGQDDRSGVSNRLFDSVADKVIQGASVPVLAIPDMEGNCGVEDVLLPVGSRIASEHAVEHAAAFATEFGTTVHVVNVVTVEREAGPFDAGSVSEAYVERLKREARPAVERTVAQFDEMGADVPTEAEVITGRQHEAIDEYIAANDIDLVVAGKYAEGRIARRLLGGVPEHVLQTVDVPVLVASDPS